MLRVLISMENGPCSTRMGGYLASENSKSQRDVPLFLLDNIDSTS